MSKKAIVFFIIIFSVVSVFADDRPPRDFMVVVDKSLSMTEEIRAVKEFIKTNIIDQYLQPGDFFLVITFYGDSVIPISTFIRDQAQIEDIKSRIDRLQANGEYTDISGALERLKEEREQKSSPDRTGLLVLITDYLNNPRPGSEFYTADKEVISEYLTDKEYDEQQVPSLIDKGVKVIFLDIGGGTNKDLAEKFQADKYISVSEEEAQTEIEVVLGVTTADASGISLTPVDQDRQSTLTVPVTTQFYTDSVSITINEIYIDNQMTGSWNLLSEPYSATLPAEGQTELDVPLLFPQDMEPDDYAGAIRFVFSSDETFEPGPYSVQFHVNSIWENYTWLLPVLIGGGVIVLALLVFFIISMIKNRTVAFKMLIEESAGKKGQNIHKLAFGKELYLQENMEIFRLFAKKSARSMAAVKASQKGLTFSVLREDRFPSFVGTMDNVLDNTVVVRSERGNDFHLNFIKA